MEATLVQSSKTGHIVWHDLLTTNVSQARQFYAELMGWNYEVEHAADFVWKSGEADYPLILHDGEAHGGFVEIEPDQQSHWLAFVAVDDVDGTAKRSEALGGTIEKPPFDIPGVGRSAVIRDPQGAVICPFVASHNYPAPIGLFIWDELLTAAAQDVQRFYETLFTWSAKQADTGDTDPYTSFTAIDDGPAAGALTISEDLDVATQWVPYLGVADVDRTTEKAKSLGAHIMIVPTTVEHIGRFALLRDPTGALFGLMQPLS